MGSLKILKTKRPVGKDPKFLVVLNGRPLSGHRTLKGARTSFNDKLRIAKSQKKKRR